MISLESILNIIQGHIICVSDHQSREFSCAEEVMTSGLYTNHTVTAIRSIGHAIVLELQPKRVPVTDLDADWVKKYSEQNGSDPSYF